MPSKKKIYLAGPIAGLSYEEAAIGWRKEFALLIPEHIECYSPMRNKEFLKGVKNLNSAPDSYNHNALSSTKGIFSRDHNDVKTSDAVVFYLKDTPKASVGTIFEMAWANQYRIPTVAIMEKDGLMKSGEKNPHWHAFVTESMNYIVEDLEDAAHIITTILTPGV